MSENAFERTGAGVRALFENGETWRFEPIGGVSCMSRAVDATDPDPGDTISAYLLDSTTTPAGMTIHPTTGVISWTPSALQVGDNVVRVIARDSTGAFSRPQTFTVSVRGDETAPAVAVTSTPSTMALGESSLIQGERSRGQSTFREGRNVATIRAHRRRQLPELGGMKIVDTMHERRHGALIPACDRRAKTRERSSWFRPIPGAATDEVLAALAGASTLRVETSLVIANTAAV